MKVAQIQRRLNENRFAYRVIRLERYDGTQDKFDSKSEIATLMNTHANAQVRDERQSEFMGSIFDGDRGEVRPEFTWQNAYRSVKWRDESSSYKFPLTESAVWFNNKIHIVDKVSFGLCLSNVKTDNSHETDEKKRPIISILKGTRNLIQSKRDTIDCDDFPDIGWFFKTKKHEAPKGYLKCSKPVNCTKLQCSRSMRSFDSPRNQFVQGKKSPRRIHYRDASKTTSDGGSLLNRHSPDFMRQRSPDYMRSLLNPVLSKNLCKPVSTKALKKISRSFDSESKENLIEV